ncbi:MAG: adenylosuccinate lyase [Planctomycetes bacterium]|nr:adenylosuccinate lyase [Planctomycetota bacterium]
MAEEGGLLATRYASEEMRRNFSDGHRYGLWRRIWTALAEIEASLGVPIPAEAIAAMRAGVDRIDFTRVAEIEKKNRHDVMAHIAAFGEACPAAKGFIHLGATSCCITDNADLILMREGLEIVKTKLLAAIDALARFAREHKDLPALAYTHLQPAQPTTVGRRAAMWLQDLLLDLDELDGRIAALLFRGAKGATGTQAGYLELFGGDEGKVRALDRALAERFGFADTFAVTGQTYPRKVDAQVLSTLAGIAVSAHKFSSDVRLLQAFHEIEEPFGRDQVGSSVMAYKRNPMRCERMGSLAKYVMALAQNPAMVAATQFLERTLDDSANRRLAIPEAFLAVDAILVVWQDVASGLVVHEPVIQARLAEELPFLATEAILAAGASAGGDREVLHAAIRRHARAVADARNEGRREAGLLERLAGDPVFAAIRDRLPDLVDPVRFTGRASNQVEEFLRERVEPVLEREAHRLGKRWEPRV